MVANADGSDLRPLFEPMIFQAWSWSPDSRSIAVVAPIARGRQLSIVPIDGGEPRILALDKPLVSDVEWLPPDGRELVAMLASRGRAQFFAIPVDGSEPRQISRDDMVFPPGGLFAIAPDGRTIVYEHSDPRFTLRVLNVETGEERVFGENLPALTGGGPFHVGHPIISSDGERLVFGRYWDDDFTMINHQMWVAALDGDGSDAAPIGPLKRTEGGTLPYAISTAPDGTRVIVHWLDTQETWSTDLDGANLQNLDLGVFGDLDWQRLAP
jgi:Tol biopolymer transport system component